MHLNPWHILVIAMAGWMNREQTALRERLVNCVREEHSALARFRPELSYIPTER